MLAIAPQDVFEIVSDLLTYVDESERSLQSLRSRAAATESRLKQKQTREMQQLDSSYSARISDVRSRTGRVQADAHRMLDEVIALEAKLEQVDRYYVKTKAKRESDLSSSRDALYDSSENAFETIEVLKRRHEELIDRYTNKILPAIINGLHYLFSSKRKKDYEDLLVLKFTIMAFISEIDVSMPELCSEEVRKLQAAHADKKRELSLRHSSELEQSNSASAEAELSLLKERAERLDAILPNELIDYFVMLEVDYQSCAGRVNTSGEIKNGVIQLSDLAVPLASLCSSSEMQSIVQGKLQNLSYGEDSYFPLPMSTGASPCWYIVKEDGSQSAEAFVLSIMHDFLVHSPVQSLEFMIADPENRGSSISPFFDARKRLPELFSERIYTSNDQIAELIDSTNAYIEDILQERLGTQYESIFDFAADNPNYQPEIKLLVIFDFPKAMDERTVSSLRPILRSGRRAGVYCAIIQGQDGGLRRSEGLTRAIQSVMELSTVVRQANGLLLVRGLELVATPMPDKSSFASYFSRYLLINEGIQNKGIAFSAQVKRLAESTCDDDALAAISDMEMLDAEFLDRFGRVPDADSLFLQYMPIGKVDYPASLFMESGGINAIVQHFHIRRREDADMLVGSVSLPILIDFATGFNIYLCADERDIDSAVQLSHHLIWDYLSSVPVTKARLIVMDEMMRGNSVTPFLDLKQHVPEVFGDGICTNQDSIRRQLQDLNEHIDRLIQEKLGTTYANILEYNAASPSRSEALRLLVIYDFPNGLDARSLGYLANILRNGGKCGVNVLLCGRASYEVSRYDNTQAHIDTIQQLSTVVACRDGKYRLDPHGLILSIPPLPRADLTSSFGKDYSTVYEQLQKRGLSFEDIVGSDHFTGDASAGLSIPIGIGDGDSIVNLTFGSGSSHHALVAGATGSGKSTLMHTIIMSSMLKYSPEQLNLYLMDFKGGTEFKIYETARLPHIKLLALDAMQEFGESILENLVAEMERRSRLFKDAGTANLKDYVRGGGQSLPRILVMMDEFQILFNYATNRKVANNCAELAKRIVTEGRSYGIHLLMATQSTKVISDLTLSRGSIEQMRIRIGLKCGEYDARYLFTDKNEKSALNMMSGPIGTAVLNEEYMEQDNIGFRVAYCDDATQAKYLSSISEEFAATPYDLQTFEGGRTTQADEFYLGHGIVYENSLPVKIRLGELIKVAPPLELVLDRRHRHNLLICGANEQMSKNIVGLYILSALMNANTTVYCIDGDRLMGDTSSDELYEVFSRHFGARFSLAGEDDDVFRFVKQVYETYAKAKRGARQGSQSILVVKDMQFIESFKKMIKGERIDDPTVSEASPAEALPTEEENPADPFASINSYFAQRNATQNSSKSDSSKTPTEMVRELIDAGSSCGSHIVVSSLEFQTVSECMKFADHALTKFPERIMFSLGENDAFNLMENVSISSLRDNTVFFTDGVRNTFQLKPFRMPNAQRLDDFLSEILGK